MLINSTFKISNLYPPLREFMRMPDGAQAIYVVDNTLQATKHIMNYIARAQGHVLIETMLAVPANGGLSENLLKCTVLKSAALKSAPPANKPGPKTPPTE